MLNSFKLILFLTVLFSSLSSMAIPFDRLGCTASLSKVPMPSEFTVKDHSLVDVKKYFAVEPNSLKEKVINAYFEETLVDPNKVAIRSRDFELSNNFQAALKQPECGAACVAKANHQITKYLNDGIMLNPRNEPSMDTTIKKRRSLVEKIGVVFYVSILAPIMYVIDTIENRSDIASYTENKNIFTATLSRAVNDSLKRAGLEYNSKFKVKKRVRRPSLKQLESAVYYGNSIVVIDSGVMLLDYNFSTQQALVYDPNEGLLTVDLVIDKKGYASLVKTKREPRIMGGFDGIIHISGSREIITHNYSLEYMTEFVIEID